MFSLHHPFIARRPFEDERPWSHHCSRNGAVVWVWSLESRVPMNAGYLLKLLFNWIRFANNPVYLMRYKMRQNDAFPI